MPHTRRAPSLRKWKGPIGCARKLVTCFCHALPCSGWVLTAAGWEGRRASGHGALNLVCISLSESVILLSFLAQPKVPLLPWSPSRTPPSPCTARTDAHEYHTRITHPHSCVRACSLARMHTHVGRGSAKVMNRGAARPSRAPLSASVVAQQGAGDGSPGEGVVYLWRPFSAQAHAVWAREITISNAPARSCGGTPATRWSGLVPTSPMCPSRRL